MSLMTYVNWPALVLRHMLRHVLRHNYRMCVLVVLMLQVLVSRDVLCEEADKPTQRREKRSVRFSHWKNVDKKRGNCIILLDIRSMVIIKTLNRVSLSLTVSTQLDHSITKGAYTYHLTPDQKLESDSQTLCRSENQHSLQYQRVKSVLGWLKMNSLPTSFPFNELNSMIS